MRPQTVSLALGIFALAALVAPAGASANPSVAGIVPPGHPSANCLPGVASDVALVDRCRAFEGVGPLVLPSNYAGLSAPEQLFVIVNLERVNRGEPPALGLSSSLDQYAEEGAASGSDPALPQSAFAGSVWAGGAGSALAADYAWMYDDGYPGGNVDCAAPAQVGCWAHRDIILAPSPATSGEPLGLVAGTAFVGSPAGGGSYTFVLAYGYQKTDFVFTWAQELPYFTPPPGLEPLGESPSTPGTVPSGALAARKACHSTGTCCTRPGLQAAVRVIERLSLCH